MSTSYDIINKLVDFSIFIFHLYIVVVMVIVSAFWITPVLLVFYGRVLSKLQFGGGGVLVKLVFDQLLFSPFFTASIVTLRIIMMKEIPYSELLAALYVMIPKSIVTSWMFWIPARGVIIYLVPPHLQIVTGSILSVVWNILFSMILRKMN